MTITLSFKVDVVCQDKHCPDRAYETQHSHTLYNVYEIPARLHYAGMDEITVSEIATATFPFQLAPVNSMKGALQNV